MADSCSDGSGVAVVSDRVVRGDGGDGTGAISSRRKIGGAVATSAMMRRQVKPEPLPTAVVEKGVYMVLIMLLLPLVLVVLGGGGVLWMPGGVHNTAATAIMYMIQTTAP